MFDDLLTICKALLKSKEENQGISGGNTMKKYQRNTYIYIGIQSGWSKEHVKGYNG